jgi:hypothetical protein
VVDGGLFANAGIEAEAKPKPKPKPKTTSTATPKCLTSEEVSYIYYVLAEYLNSA